MRSVIFVGSFIEPNFVGRAMNAIDLLRNDHQRLMRLATDSQESQSPIGSEGSQFEEFVQTLTLHMRMEEEILYPELAQFDETRLMVNESYEDHRAIQKIAGKLNDSATELTGEAWASSVTRLIRAIEAHISHDEEELLPRAETLLGATGLQEIFYDMDEIRTHQSDVDSLIYPASRLGPKM